VPKITGKAKGEKENVLVKWGHDSIPMNYEKNLGDREPQGRGMVLA